MNEIRKELERNLTASVQQKKEQSPDELPTVDITETPEEISVEKTIISAPKSYKKQFAEDFKNLSPQWQNYLLEREAQVEKGFTEANNKINSYKVLEDIFNQNKNGEVTNNSNQNKSTLDSNKKIVKKIVLKLKFIKIMHRF